MLIWLNGLTGMSLPSMRNPVESLIETYAHKPINIAKFLEEDEFLIQLKHMNSKLLDFVYRERL